MLLTLAKYDPEYAKAYREKQRAKRDAARKSGDVAPPPPPKTKPPVRATKTPVTQSVVELTRDESLPSACACSVSIESMPSTSVTRDAQALTDDQLKALTPSRGGWTTTTRAKTVATLKKTPAGRQLLKTLDSFQSGASVAIPRLRTDIEKYLANGANTVEAGRSATVRNLLDSLAQSDATDRKLYRGMIAPSDLNTVLGRYKTGDTLDLSLASFSADKKLAEEFSEVGAGKRVRGATRTPVVIEWVSGSKRALPIENLAKSRVFSNEKEWVGSGRYRILDVLTKKRTYKDGRDASTVVVLRIEQEKTW
jgi:hypothetical protein